MYIEFDQQYDDVCLNHRYTMVLFWSGHKSFC